MNIGGMMLYFDGIDFGIMNYDNMSKDEVYKNMMCKDGCCLDVNDKVGDDVNIKMDGII